MMRGWKRIALGAVFGVVVPGGVLGIYKWREIERARFEAIAAATDKAE